MRSSLLDVLGEEYITTVRAKGVREDRVLWRHAVRNALLPTVSVIALSFGFVIGGALTVELVFSYPGVGLLTIEALESQDFLLLQGLFLFFSVVGAGRELRRGPVVQLDRPPGAGGVSDGRPRDRARRHPQARSARSFTWARRRRPSSGSGASYRRSWMGLAGLAILVVFVLVAIFAPVLVRCV